MCDSYHPAISCEKTFYPPVITIFLEFLTVYIAMLKIMSAAVSPT